MDGAQLCPYQDYFLRPGYIYVPCSPTLISTVLGSCVAVALWDRKRRLGGMSHFRYPAAGGAREATAQFGNVAITVLVRLFLDEGSERRDLEAQLFGGAVPPRGEPGPEETGRQNVDVGRMVLTRHGIPIVSEDVGGVKGRKLIYDTQTNEVVVLRVDQLRAGDWYPYKDDR